MNSPGTHLRARVAKNVDDMLYRLRIQLSMDAAPNLPVIAQLSGEPMTSVVARVTNRVLEELGFEVGAPKEARFDKTHRAIAKNKPKPPRGMSKAEKAAALLEPAT